MSLFNLLGNTVTGVAQTAIGATKLAASPLTQLVDITGKSHAEDAIKNINDGVKKIGSDK